MVELLREARPDAVALGPGDMLRTQPHALVGQYLGTHRDGAPLLSRAMVRRPTQSIRTTTFTNLVDLSAVSARREARPSVHMRLA